MSDRRALVVGTTPDYIAYIHNRYRGRALFVTDPSQRTGSTEDKPDAASEIVCDLWQSDRVLTAVKRHLRRYEQNLSGITCFDCEWLGLASYLAGELRLPYPSPESIRLSRNKYLSKQRWVERSVRCPRTRSINSRNEAFQFFEELGGNPIVLKPLSGSGSELTFVCHDRHGIAQSLNILGAGLRQRGLLPMYQPQQGGNGTMDPREVVLAEEFISGREYSCDFSIEDGKVKLVRVAKKLSQPGLPFGTTVAYIVPARLPNGLDEEHLSQRLREAAEALAISRAVCMVDFMISHGEVVFLELTPRIGGDCLPPLVRQSCGMDTIELALDFAEERPLVIPEKKLWTQLIGLRLFAPTPGLFKGVDATALKGDSRVREVYIKRSPGHTVTLPPEDYDSWMLGHVIFELVSGSQLAMECEELRSLIHIDMESYHDQKFAGIHSAGRRTA
ncbi:MAG: ATP-grasp domain-containing protein [Candidatus Zixiibacteriota bacterium]|nr:MAG: ATP-grasp domain-containing protein [candidate division Zixibacteria bacterium]